jgi:hypothetical protein
MQLQSAIITIKGITLAAILVDPDQTYPEPGARLIIALQRYFPTLPILLVSPRIGGFSRSCAHFDTTNIIKYINADAIDWQPTALPIERADLPF